MAKPLARKLHDMEALEAAREYIDLSWEVEKWHIASRGVLLQCMCIRIR